MKTFEEFLGEASNDAQKEHETWHNELTKGLGEFKTAHRHLHHESTSRTLFKKQHLQELEKRLKEQGFKKLKLVSSGKPEFNANPKAGTEHIQDYYDTNRRTVSVKTNSAHESGSIFSRTRIPLRHQN